MNSFACLFLPTLTDQTFALLPFSLEVNSYVIHIKNKKKLPQKLYQQTFKLFSWSRWCNWVISWCNFLFCCSVSAKSSRTRSASVALFPVPNFISTPSRWSFLISSSLPTPVASNKPVGLSSEGSFLILCSRYSFLISIPSPQPESEMNKD